MFNKIINENKKAFNTVFENVELSNKTIICVDIQPEYENGFGFNVYDFTQFLNENVGQNRIVLLYNGEDTLGMISESDYSNWLLENGLEYETLDMITFYDKGYAFFRYCMDSNIDEDLIADLVRFLYNKNIYDSRDLDSDVWDEFQEKTHADTSEIRELLEFAGDCLSIPDLMEFLSNFRNIILTGGGINECLKEVEIALKAMNINYNILNEYTY